MNQITWKKVIQLRNLMYGTNLDGQVQELSWMHLCKLNILTQLVFAYGGLQQKMKELGLYVNILKHVIVLSFLNY